MADGERSGPPGPPPAGPATAEDRYRLVVECVRDYAIFMLDAQGRITTWNAGAVSIKGWRAEEIIGRHFSTFYTDEEKGWKPAMELEVAARTGRFEDEGWRIRKDGTRFWANVVITALRDSAGNLVGFGKVTRDLTDRRRAEEVRLQLARAEEAVRVRDRFVATLSHELRNPLAPIRNSLHILQRTTPGSAMAGRALEVIDRQVTLLGGIIEDLMDVSRLVRGTLEVAREPLDLAALARAAVEDHRGLFQEHGLALACEGTSEPLWVEGDPTRLRQLLGNLLQNARKFTPRGGHVSVTAARDGGAAELRVRDDGVGMEPGLLARLFQPFVQADRTLARSQGGLGLGLALVKGFAELHGGSVTATSEGPGRGSEFLLRLPVSAAARGRAPEAPLRAPTSGRRVLVVDDNVDAAESLAEMLRLLGHEVAVAHDGPHALERAQREPPDVVLCDLGLPGLDGYAVARALRADPALSGSLLVAVSGYAGEVEVRRALEAGFDRHLAKPADPFEVERLVG